MVIIQWRRGQKEASDAIVRAIESGKKTIVLSGSVGTGKTLLIANALKELGLRAFYTTPQRSLVKQIQDDDLFREIYPEMVTILGRNNWICHRDRKTRVDKALCYELDASNEQPIKSDSGRMIPCRFKKWPIEEESGMVLPICPYYEQKAKAEMAPLFVSTLAYLIVAAGSAGQSPTEMALGWDRGKLSGRDVLVVDEAHGLAEHVVQFIRAGWSRRSYSESFGREFEEWVEKIGYGFALWEPGMKEVEKAEVLKETFLPLLYRESERIVGDSPEGRKLNWAMQRLESIITDMEQEIPWVVEVYRDERGERLNRLSMTPVIVTKHLQRYLWSKANAYILSSGTFLNPVETIKELGLDPELSEVVVVESDFPPKNCPIKMLHRTAMKHQNREGEIQEVAKVLWEVMDSEHGNGLVHTKSFINATDLYWAAPDHYRRRLLLHNPDSNRIEMIAAFLHSRNKVLLSPSLTEGIDLLGDKGEWAFFVKCPYPNIGEERVKRRLEMTDGWAWFERQALIETMQGHGRVTRSNTDKSRTYIVDVNHSRLVHRYWKQLPGWFRDRVEEPNLIGRYLSKGEVVLE